MVIAQLEGADVILCQITSQTVRDTYAVSVNESDFAEGSLRQPSNIRPNRIFTADSHIVLYRVGCLTNRRLAEVIDKVVEVIRN